MADESTVPQAKQKVHDTLEGSFDDVVFNDDGTASFRYGSARVFVSVEPFDEDSSVVLLKAPVVSGATVSPELYEYVATGADDTEFGHLTVSVEPDGTATINFSHTLLGDYLDDMELRVAAVAVAFTADALDEQLVERFGGRRFHNDD